MNWIITTYTYHDELGYSETFMWYSNQDKSAAKRDIFEDAKNRDTILDEGTVFTFIELNEDLLFLGEKR